MAAAQKAIDGAEGHGVEGAVRELRQAARTDPSLGEVVSQGEEAAMLVAEFSAEIGRIAETLERDPGALDRIEARLALLGDLRRKYGDSLAEVLAFGERTALRVAELEDLYDRKLWVLEGRSRFLWCVLHPFGPYNPAVGVFEEEEDSSVDWRAFVG